MVARQSPTPARTHARAHVLIATCFAVATVHIHTLADRGDLPAPDYPAVQVTDYIGYVCLGFVCIKDRFPFLLTL